MVGVVRAMAILVARVFVAVVVWLLMLRLRLADRFVVVDGS